MKAPTTPKFASSSTKLLCEYVVNEPTKRYWLMPLPNAGLLHQTSRPSTIIADRTDVALPSVTVSSTRWKKVMSWTASPKPSTGPYVREPQTATGASSSTSAAPTDGLRNSGERLRSSSSKYANQTKTSLRVPVV